MDLSLQLLFNKESTDALRKVWYSQAEVTTKTISLRLPESLIAPLKVIANKRDVPYQSLMKVFLAERLQEELGDLDNKPVERTARRSRTQ
jgi:predicted DNA binding CopG/RHH family protein